MSLSEQALMSSQTKRNIKILSQQAPAEPRNLRWPHRLNPDLAGMWHDTQRGGFAVASTFLSFCGGVPYQGPTTSNETQRETPKPLLGVSHPRTPSSSYYYAELQADRRLSKEKRLRCSGDVGWELTLCSCLCLSASGSDVPGDLPRGAVQWPYPANNQ